MQRPATLEFRPPPESPSLGARSPGAWLRQNLFRTWYDTILTLLFTPLIVYAVFRAVRFVLVSGRWSIVEVNLTSFMVGTFPRGEVWRIGVALLVLGAVVGLALGVLARTAAEEAEARGTGFRPAAAGRAARAGPAIALLAGLLWFARTPTPFGLAAGAIALGTAGFVAGRRSSRRARPWLNTVVIGGILAAYFVVAGFGGIGWDRWGGLLLTAFFTVGGILLSFPFGVLLALGRRSSLPAVRMVCVAYIELIRGVPLVALLFMGWLVLGFFLPPGTRTPDIVTRALIIFVLFTAAYIAEIVRGGLQGVHAGQLEAARAVGLSPWKATRLIILPQALRSVIPALVGQFISLYKDTTLVFAIGLFDLLAVARSVTTQPDFLGQRLLPETLFYVSFIYWVGCYWMSKESQRLERKMGVGER